MYRHTNAVRVFKLPSGPEDYALMLTSDYEAAIANCAAVAASAGSPLPDLRSFEWFCKRVLPRCTDVLISKESLMNLMSINHGYEMRVYSVLFIHVVVGSLGFFRV